MSGRKGEKLWRLAVLFVAAAGIAVGLALLFSANNGRGASPGHRVEPMKTTVDEKAVPPSAVPQPPTAADVAKQLNCTGFTSTGGGGLGGTITAGRCYIGTRRYAINTFASTEARDGWLEMTERLGVVPWKETPTAVIYPSVTS